MWYNEGAQVNGPLSLFLFHFQDITFFYLCKKVPLLLTLDVHPVAASATSSISIFFTSLIASTSYAVFGLIVPDYAYVCFVLGLFCTFVGRRFSSWSSRQLEDKALILRDTFVVFTIGIVVLLSAVLMTIEEVKLITGGCEQALRSSGGLCS